ncbi:phage major tail protein, TP901-1 family [Enterococcus casseliflavus]|uniref:phage tail tube protein n=1 Tax=Enterococcus casseliflavus TaxID=37734 RepID=UPI002DBA2C40|nr:phage major tail protein, TP901-1 family [Enterococcus casseliflavus]MEB6213526.1 phage major tail protein, TP901-1 family [Enterococcus casseliflavus]
MAIKGIDFLVKVNTGTTELPNYVSVAGQRGASLSRDAETMDSTSKDSQGWNENLSGFKSWSIDSDGLLVEDDAGYLALEDAYMEGEPVIISLTTASGNKYEGKAIVTSLPLDAPYDDLATYEVTFTGTGALAKVQ